MTETERIRRVREMERRMHELSAAAEGLQTALAAYEAALLPAARWRTTTKAPSGRRTSPPTRPGCCPRISAAASSPRTRCLTCWATPTPPRGAHARRGGGCAHQNHIVRPVMTTKHARRAGGCARTDAVPAPMPAHAIPDPDIVFANEYGTSCFLKRSSPPRTSPWVTNTPVRHLPRSEVPAFLP